MRKLALACVTILAAAACGTDPMSGGDDDGMGSGSGSGSGSDLEQPARGLQLKSPEITIPAGKEQTWCWYFKTPNTDLLSIKRWVSKMTPGSHHMIVYFTSSLQQPEGTVSQENCGVGGGSLNVPSWIFAAQTIDSDMALPTDDGNGQPLGMDVPPGQAGFIQMHYLNSTDDDLKVHVTVNGEAHDAGVVATKTAAYVTFNGSLDIPAGAMNDIETKSCDVPANTKMWLMSTHAHKQAIKTEVRDGTDVVFSSTDWEHPGVKSWMTTPFYTFASGKLTYECTYDNPTNRTITTGDSAQTDEMCMATGYYFPATKPRICYNEYLLP